MALCRARNASASPPARLLGVARPLSVPLPLPRLTALSRGCMGGAIGFLPPGVGLLAGGVGAGGLPLARPLAAAGVGRAGAAGGGGGGGGARCSTLISSMYAVGVQP